LEGRLGVAVEHAGVLETEELIFDARETGAFAAFEADDDACFVGVDDGHAVDGGGFVTGGGGVDDVVGPDDDGDVHHGHLGVDGIHLDELFVGHVGLGEEHVHVAGHATGDGVNGEAHFGTVFFEHFGEFTHDVLGLGDGHTVAGHDDDVAGGFEDGVTVFGRDGLEFTFHGAGSLAAGGRGGVGAETGEEHVG